MLTAGCSELFPTRISGRVNGCLSRLLRNFKVLSPRNPRKGLILVLFNIIYIGCRDEKQRTLPLRLLHWKKVTADAGRQGVSNAAKG